MHLQILRWYCADQEHAHATTLPCENYQRQLAFLAAKSKGERQAVDSEKRAVAPKNAAEVLERVRLVKASYAAMRTAYCNVPAHQLACLNPELLKEYEDLSRATSTPAESLDRKVYHVLTIKRKAKLSHEASAKRPEGASVEGKVRAKGRQHVEDAYLTDVEVDASSDSSFDPPT